MNTNINLSTITKTFSLCNEKNHTFLKQRTKLATHSLFLINEIDISYIVSKIPHFYNFYCILDDWEKVNISQLNDNNIAKLTAVKDTYYLCSYTDNNSVEFIDYLFQFISIKKLIFSMIHAFSHLLNSLQLINENNICFFSISPQNIVFLFNSREKPLLNDFSLSIRTKKLDYVYLSQIINKSTDFTYKPFEIHILYYFIKYNMTTISYSFIEEFCETFMNNLHILHLFSANYKRQYKEQCIESMKKYINVPKNNIIDDILAKHNKWDVYGVSVLFIHVFACISQVFSLKGTFISKITIALSQNVHPNPDKRMCLEETLRVFSTLLSEEKWSFVNKLDNRKLSTLFEKFSE